MKCRVKLKHYYISHQDYFHQLLFVGCTPVPDPCEPNPCGKDAVALASDDLTSCVCVQGEKSKLPSGCKFECYCPNGYTWKEESTTCVSKEDENDVFQFDYDPCWDKVLPCKILEDTCQCSCSPGLSLDHNDYICKPGNPCEPNPCGPDCTLERYGDQCQCRWCDTDGSGYGEPTTTTRDPTKIYFPRSNFPKSSNSSPTKFSFNQLFLLPLLSLFRI